jgi:multiple sugar transport system permease protein
MRTDLSQLASPGQPEVRARRRDWSTIIAFWAFISPMLLGLAIFVFAPIVWGFLLSFSRASGTVSIGNWVGLSNYISLVNDPAFQKAIITIIVYTAFIVPVTFFFSLGLAMLVNNITRGRSFFRTVFFIPTAVSYVVASMIWKMSIFNGLPYGVANLVVELFGAQTIYWVGTASPPWYWVVLVTVRLWLQVGFYMIIFVAGLQEIPRTYYEAAYVDGARPGWATFRHITFPLLRNTSVSVLLLLFIAAFQAFAEFWNILGGTLHGSGNITLARPPLVYLYQMALGDQNYGLASAGAFILFVIILLVTFAQNWTFGFGSEE